MAKRTRLAIRGFADGVQLFEEPVDIPEKDLDRVVTDLAVKHAELMKGRPHMIEIEFLDEPDINQRFFRLGTDPRGMVLPLALPYDRPSE
jgi:hypothetical protein